MSTPLFSPSMVQLQSDLRLTGVPTLGEDANSIIANAVLEVRTGFYRRLGLTRVGQLVAITANDTAPTTNDQVLRAIARTVEVKWMFVVLMDRLPMLWMDDSGGAWQQFNEQGTFRKMSNKDRSEMRDRLLAEIEQAMVILSGEQTLGEETGINVGTYGNEICPRPTLTDIIWPAGFNGDFTLDI
jgi:hypothetical protein